MQEKLCMMYEVWETTRFKDGAIYCTRYTGERIWVPVGTEVPRQDGILLYIPTAADLQKRSDWVIPTIETKE